MSYVKHDYFFFLQKLFDYVYVKAYIENFKLVSIAGFVTFILNIIISKNFMGVRFHVSFVER